MGAMRMMTTIICLALAVLPVAAPAWATDYWIDGVSGDDSNDGLSRATAWKTLGKANAIVAAGDTVHVLAGVYRQQAIWPNNSGTNNANRITYVAEGNVEIEQGYIGPSSYTTFEGFEVRNFDGHGFYIRGNGVTLRRCRAIRNRGGGIVAYTPPLYNLVVDRCVIAYNQHGIYPYYGGFNNATVTHTTFAYNRELGLYLYGHANRVENSIIAFNGTGGVYDNPTDIFENNDVYGNGNWQYFHGPAGKLSDVQVDPKFLDPANGLFYLQPTSPLIGQASDGRSIGALGVGYQSAAWADGWAGWTDGNGVAVGGAGAEVEKDANGHLKLRDDVTVAVARSPVIDADLPGVAFITFDFDALEVTDLPAGSRQVVDFDPSTREREARFRVASTAAGIASAPWNVAVSGAPVGAPGRFIQIEYTLRRDGN